VISNGTVPAMFIIYEKNQDLFIAIFDGGSLCVMPVLAL